MIDIEIARLWEYAEEIEEINNKICVNNEPDIISYTRNKENVKRRKTKIGKDIKDFLDSKNAWEIDGMSQHISGEDEEYSAEELIYLIERYREYTIYTRNHSENPDEREKVVNIYENLMAEKSSKGKTVNDARDFVSIVSPDILKSLLNNGKIQKSFQYQYDFWVKEIGEDYIKEIIEMLKEARDNSKLSNDILIYELQCEGCLDTKEKYVDEIVVELKRLSVIEQKLEKQISTIKTEELEKLKKIVSTEYKRKSEEEQNNQVIERRRYKRRKKEIKNEKRLKREIGKKTGMSIEFTNRIKELRESKEKETVLPIFLKWYDKNEKDFNSNNLQEFRELLFSFIKEKYSYGNVSLFLLTDGKKEEGIRIMNQIHKEALKYDLKNLVEGVAIGHGSQMIEIDGRTTDICVMSEKIHRKIVEISSDRFKDFLRNYR